MNGPQASSPTTWLKCFSQSRNKVYYYNTNTKESLWDEPKADIVVITHESFTNMESTKLSSEKSDQSLNDDEIMKKLYLAQSMANKSHNEIKSPLTAKPANQQNNEFNEVSVSQSTTANPHQVQDCAQSTKDSSYEAETLEKLFACNAKRYQAQSTQKRNGVVDPVQVQEREDSTRSTIFDDDDEKILKKLYSARENVNGGVLTTLKDYEPCTSQSMKRKNEEYTAPCNNKYSLTDYTARQPTKGSSQLSLLSEKEGDSSSAIKTVTSANTSFSKYCPDKPFIGKSKTPIQDRFDKLKEDLLKKQEQNNNVRHENSEKLKSSIHSRLGWRKPILKSISAQTDKMPDNSNVYPGTKRKSSSSQGEVDGYSDESGISAKKRISFGGVEVSSPKKSYGKQITPDGIGRSRGSSISLEPNLPVDETKQSDAMGSSSSRMSLDLNSPVREKKPFGEFKRHSLETDVPTKRHSKFDGVKRHSLESSAVINPNTFGDLRMKLKRKQLETINNCQSDDSYQMDWEPSSTNELTQHEVVSPVISNIMIEEQSPIQERHPGYQNVYLVCDTSALLDDDVFVEQIIVNGSYLGLPLTVVIPYVVFDELDKLKTKIDVGHKARNISRIIQSNRSSKHLQMQEGGKKREAVCSFELTTNDDLVLNCCLQMRETCSESELAVMMTTDINLGNKAASFKIQSYNWNSFKRWARGFREYKHPSPQNPNKNKQVKLNNNRLPVEEEEMDMDTNVTKFESKTKSSDYSLRISQDDPITEDDKLPLVATSSKNTQLQNCIQSHLEELRSDFQTFLHNVLDEAVEKEHGHLKKFTSNIKPSWTLYDYVIEVRNRWFLISSAMLPIRVQEMLSRIIALLKKYNAYNSGKGEFKVEDVYSYFSVCANLGSIITKHFPNHGRFFLQRLKNLRQEWIEALNTLSSQSNLQNVTEEDVQPVDVALQNIYNYLQSYYENLKAQHDSNKCDQEFKQLLLVFHDKITNLELVIEKAYKDSVNTLTCNNKNLIQFHESISCFSGITGSPFGFDIGIENVMEFFQDSSYRNSVKHLLYNLEHLKFLIDELSGGLLKWH